MQVLCDDKNGTKKNIMHDACMAAVHRAQDHCSKAQAPKNILCIQLVYFNLFQK